MKKSKSLGFSIFFVVLTIILIALIIFTVGVNYIFGSSVRSGKVFGKNIFVMNSDIMSPELKKGAAIISESDEISVLIEGNVILFNEDTGFENVMRIVEVVHNTDQTVYRVAGDNAQDNILNVPKENVIAKCTKVIPNLGKTILFLKSITGILLGMILPCIILLVMLLVKIFSVRRKNRLEDDEIVYPETSFGIGNSKNEEKDYSANPLFDPTMAPKPDASFAMKKSSIAENFSMKTPAKKTPTNPIERIMQKENAVEKFRAAVDEKPAAPISRKASLAPNSTASDKTEKMAAIKAALNNSENVPTFEKADNLNTNTNTFEASADISAKPEPPINPKPVKQEPAPVEPPKPKTAPKRKQDNIKSIDDLIKALEEEKKKL